MLDLRLENFYYLCSPCLLKSSLIYIAYAYIDQDQILWNGAIKTQLRLDLH